MTNRHRRCRRCGQTFTVSTAEVIFYASRTSRPFNPRACRDCRLLLRKRLDPNEQRRVHMSETWREYFTREDLIEQHALATGIPPDRAGRFARRVAVRPVSADLLRRVGEPSDATVRAAHDLLTLLAPAETPPLAAVRLLAIPAEGQCVRGVIFINPGGEYYLRATRGDLLPLAVLIHHEQYHARHGSNEPRALGATLRFVSQHAPQRTDLSEDITQRLEGTEWT